MFWHQFLQSAVVPNKIFGCYGTINYNTVYSTVRTDIDNIYGVVQDCNDSSALAMELLQSGTKPSPYENMNSQNTSPNQYAYWDDLEKLTVQ